jgi:glycosyltransferase involved in cell wall biosynthesis
MLVARGHDLSIGVEILSNSSENDWPRASGLDAWLLDSQSLTAQIREFRPDAILNNQIASPDLEKALVATGKATLFLHSYGGLCISGRRMHQVPQPTPCQRAFGPACLALYLPRRCGGLNPLEAIKLYAVQSNHHRQLAQYHRLIVPSDHLRVMLLQAGVDESKIVVVPHAIDHHLHSTNERAERGEPYVLLFLGRLTQEKGCLLLPEAIRRATALTGRKLRLEVAGEGPLRARLHEGLVARKLDFVFHGWVSDAHRSELLERADLLLFPSVWLEPFGLVGIEAAAHGVPAVAFPYGGVRQWLIPGATGELAESGTPTSEKLARAIARALATPEHLGLLSRNAQAQADRFTLEQNVRMLEAALGSTDDFREPDPRGG